MPIDPDRAKIDSLNEKIIRLEERNISLNNTLMENREILNKISGDLDDLKKEFSDKYVSKEQFVPVQKVVYSTIGTILIAIITAAMTLLLRK